MSFTTLSRGCDVIPHPEMPSSYVRDISTRRGTFALVNSRARVLRAVVQRLPSQTYLYSTIAEAAAAAAAETFTSPASLLVVTSRLIHPSWHALCSLRNPVRPLLILPIHFE